MVCLFLYSTRSLERQSKRPNVVPIIASSVLTVHRTAAVQAWEQFYDTLVTPLILESLLKDPAQDDQSASVSGGCTARSTTPQ
jgi:hypothetical protein